MRHLSPRFLRCAPRATDAVSGEAERVAAGVIATRRNDDDPSIDLRLAIRGRVAPLPPGVIGYRLAPCGPPPASGASGVFWANSAR